MILLHPAIDDERLAKLREAASPMEVVNGDLSRVAEAKGFIGKMTPELLAAMPRLRWVQSPTASLEHYLFPALAAHPCVLTNTRGLFGDVIAEHVLGCMLCFARNLHRYVLRQARGEWSPIGGEAARVQFTTGPGTVNDIDRAHGTINGATLGIVGLGSIGSAVKERAEAFGMRVVAVDPLRGWPMERLPQLLGESDFVVIAAPHTPRTEGLFDRAMLGRMKRSAVLVNVGRGAIVRLHDLAEALQEGVIAGAALDVFETEPLPPESPLWTMGERVILTPHVAGYGTAIAARHLAVLVENVGRFARGDALLNVVDKAEWF